MRVYYEGIYEIISSKYLLDVSLTPTLINGVVSMELSQH